MPWITVRPCCRLFPKHKSRYTPEADVIMVVNEHWMLRRVLPVLMSHPKKFTLVLYHTDYDLEPQIFECLRHKVNHIYAEGCRITHPLITKVTQYEHYRIHSKA